MQVKQDKFKNLNTDDKAKDYLMYSNCVQSLNANKHTVLDAVIAGYGVERVVQALAVTIVEKQKYHSPIDIAVAEQVPRPAFKINHVVDWPHALVAGKMMELLSKYEMLEVKK